jgi:hypothetical protein
LTSWDNTEVFEDIVMNGTTVVPTINSYVIIHRMQVRTKGPSGPNIGTITATAQIDGTITAQINPDNGQTQMAVYGIPSGKCLYLADYYFSLIVTPGAGRSAFAALVVNPEPDIELIGFLTKHTQAVADVGSSYIQHKFDPYFEICGPAIVKVQATGSTTGLDVSGGFNGDLSRPQSAQN